jgi:hypothetical protein
MPQSRVTLLSWIVAIAFVLASVLLYVDRANLVATPPQFPDTATMVDRVEGSVTYKQAIWPVFLWTNLLFGVGFIAAVAFAWVVAARVAARGGLPIFVALATTGGVIGAIASIMPIGTVNAGVWLGYCDCVSKETEIISQVWAEMVAFDITSWFSRIASLVLAVGLVALIREAGPVISPALRGWTYLAAILLAAAPLLGITELLDPVVEELVSGAVGFVVVPVWAVWLGRSIERRTSPDASPPLEGSALVA